MHNIENISIKEYLQLKDTSSYDIFIGILNPRNSFAGRTYNVNALTYNEVEIIKSIITKETQLEDIKELLIHLYNIRGNINESPDDIFFKASVFDLFKATAFLEEFVKTAYEREKKLLSSVPDDKMLMINAGERVKPVSSLLTKMTIAKDYGVTPREVGEWSYLEVFNIQVVNKIVDDLQKEYNEIK